MGYAYEDEDMDKIGEESIDLPKKKRKKSVEELMISENNSSIDELLKEEEKVELTYDNILTKKDTKLFEAYIGKNYDKITTKSFNFSALILGPIYFLYRKIYLVGFVWLFLNLFVLYMFPLVKVSYIIIIIFELLSYIASGMFANTIILNNAATHIINAKLDNKRNIKKYLKDIGGTNALIFFIVFFILIGINSLYSYQFLKIHMNDLEYSFMPKKIYKTTSYKYSGNIEYDEKFSVTDKVALIVPDNYYDISNNDYELAYQKGKSEVLPPANFSIYKIKGDISSKDYITGITSYYIDLEENIETREINNLTWYIIYISEGDKDNYFAATNVNNELYLVKFSNLYIYKEECLNDFNSIINSIVIE